jgi:hypothetical protein
LVKHAETSPAVAVNAARFGAPILLALLTFLGSVVKSLWVVLPQPQGIPVTRETAPRLVAFLDDIAGTVKAPRFDHILICGDFTAGVVQVPRFGLMGPHRNYLILGLPLMKGLSREQFQAVIAHELAHISRRHSRFGGWVYRQRMTWSQILDQVRHNWVFTPFLKWYAPYFFAHTFVLARSNEFIADRCAAEIVGARTTAETLVAAAVKLRFLEEEFWPSIVKQVYVRPDPPVSPFGAMFADDGDEPDEHTAMNRLLKAWSTHTGFDDTHPSLADRLSALGFRGVAGGPLDPPKPPLPPPARIERSAAADLLGPYGDRVTGELDVRWRRSVSAEWHREHAEAQQDIARMEVLVDRAKATPLGIDESLELVKLVARFHGCQAAAVPARSLAQRFPRSAKGQALAGAVLCESGDATGVQLMENAGRLDPAMSAQMQALIADHLRDRGSLAEAHTHQLKAEAAARRTSPMAPGR